MATDDVVVVRNGVDLERCAPVAGEAREDVVVFVGHGFARKGLATAIEAMVHVPDLSLWVVGEDRREAHYRKLVRRLGLSPRVRFLGAVDDIPTVMRRARALVLPTRYDPSANVVLEAMACAVPPVTTRFDGASEVVPMPWLVVDEPTNAIAVSKAIRQAVADPLAGARCREAARAWSLEASFEQFAAVLLRAGSVRAEVP
jgi:UDP-glucose:(heptosyl)LPS alpha-1,3-glucosyltransferase